MNNFFYYLRKEEGRSCKSSVIVVWANSYESIFVPFGYLPIPIDPMTHTDRFEVHYVVPTDDDGGGKYIYALMLINDWTLSLIDSDDLSKIESDDLSKIESAINILEYSDKEGWFWNMDTWLFEKLPKPSENSCWVYHTKSWEQECSNCCKPECPSVERLSEEINLKSLEDIYCDCKKCENCGFIFDYECKCRPDSQKPSHDSSNSRFVRCEDCCGIYDSCDETCQYIHNGWCC